MKIKELLSSPDKWAKGYYAYNWYGEMCCARSKRAVKFCLLGAGMKCYGEDWSKVRVRIQEYVATRYHKPVQFWNDDASTRFEDVKQLVEELDI